jgi:hypothetical protein
MRSFNLFAKLAVFSIILFILLVFSGCQAAQKTQPARWSRPIGFTLEYDSSSIKLFGSPGLDSNQSQNVVPVDEADGFFSIEVISIEDTSARIIIQNDTGWIEQSQLWRNPFNLADVIGPDGVTESRIALPDYEDNIHVSVDDSVLFIDNEERTLKVDLLSQRYLDFMDISQYQSIEEMAESFNVTPWRYCFTGDTLWALDLYRSGIWGISLSPHRNVDSIIISQLPDTVNITGISRIGGKFYLWGLEYEFGSCPLLEIAKAIGEIASVPRQLSREGGLLTKINDQEFLFFEQTGTVYRYDKASAGLILIDKPIINPMPYSEIIYIPVLDKFLGVVMNIF